ncbi:MAG: LysR substrate-binding domain-containing protein [Aliishimia sp.]
MRDGKSFRAKGNQQIKRLIELELVAICNPEFLVAERELTLTEILSFPLIQGTHRRWDQLFEQEGTPKALETLNFNSASLVIDAAINMQGIAIVPLLFVQDDIKAGRLKEVWRDKTPSGEFLFLMWPRNDRPSKPIADLVRWIQAEFDHDI